MQKGYRDFFWTESRKDDNIDVREEQVKSFCNPLLYDWSE